MPEKIKVYIVAMLAFSPLQDGTPGGGTYSESIPAIIPAASMDEAAEAAKKVALDRWKVSEGWYGHQANILPVTKAFYDAAFTAYDAGIVDIPDEDEPGGSYNFS
jgi:hypothetical protein